MLIIKKWQDIEALKGKISDALQQELFEYYRTIILQGIGERDYESIELTNIGKLSVLEIEEELLGIFTETPEFVDELDLDGEKFLRVTILFGESDGVVLYVPELHWTVELKAWVIKHQGGDESCK